MAHSGRYEYLREEIMRGTVKKKIAAMAREASEGHPELFDIYYKLAKKMYLKAVRSK